ncbi:MAG TPA: iron ABC transporter permease [Candidatus Kapabacteria bacterium]|nr:iron ABC transporter permease [Candidatus Kapabacteria bacterium]
MEGDHQKVSAPALSFRGKNTYNAAKLWSVLLPAILLCGVSIIISTLIGTIHISLGDLFDAATNPSSQFYSIVHDIRLPRVLLAGAVGAGLAVAGNSFQVILRNPLAEPYILGISNGCAVGVITGILFHFTKLELTAAGFAGGIIVSVIVFAWASKNGYLPAESLLLTGVMIGALGAAVLFILLALVGDSLRTALTWLLGNLSTATWDDVAIATPVVAVSTIVLWMISLPLNALAVNDDFARQLGVNVHTIQRISYGIASLIVGCLVALVGAVGFVGLIVPHIVRRVTGSDNRIVFPVSLFAGAAFTILADLLSRVVLAPSELPIGAVTALLGAPLYLWLLRKG